MKKILLAITCLWAACISCSDDTKIGAPDEILPDYVLPQGYASEEANNRIQQIFDTYTSYVLYNYTEKDAFWTQASAGGSAQTYRVTMGETRYVDAMLDYIQDIWLQFFPEEFLKKGGMPYRVFLADSIYWERDWGKIQYNYRVNGNALIIGGMNANLTAMDAATNIKQRYETNNKRTTPDIGVQSDKSALLRLRPLHLSLALPQPVRNNLCEEQ